MTLGAEVGARLSYVMGDATSGPWAVSDRPPSGLDRTRGDVYLHPAGDLNTYIAVCGNRSVAQFIVETFDAAVAVMNEHLARAPADSAASRVAAQGLRPVSTSTLQVSQDLSSWLIIEQYDPAEMSWDPADTGFCSQVTADSTVVADDLEHEDARLILLLGTYSSELLAMYESLVHGKPKRFEETWNMGPRVPGRWW